MSSTSDSFGRRAGRAFTRLVVTLIVFALIGVVGFLLSQLNARTFTLQQQDGKLLVLKGRMLPFGADP
ncbi:MAG TPA: IF-2 protein, partial [Myxococcaceae bacterium]|nr:IF-2 protein [Myxococcaceae bacterium]